MKLSKIRQAFILCGGKGERLFPLTKELPKPMIEINGRPMIEHLVEHLSDFGVEKIVFGTGYKNESISNYFGDGKKFGLKFFYSHEDEPLGTGGALKKASSFLDEFFFMLNGDNISDVDLLQMEKQHFAKKGQSTIALVKVSETKNFGIARLDGDMITEFVEKPDEKNAPSNWANAGLYIINKPCIDLIPSGFSMIEKNLFPHLAKQGELFGFKHYGKWFPTDTIEKLELARKELFKKEKETK